MSSDQFLYSAFNLTPVCKKFKKILWNISPLVHDNFLPIGHAIARGNEKQLVNAVVKNLNASVINAVSEQNLNSECAKIIYNRTSLFKRTDEEAMKTWSSLDQMEELRSVAPAFLSTLQVAAVDKTALDKAKFKSYVTILPGIMAAAGNFAIL